MMPLPPRHLLPVPLPTPFRPGGPDGLDPLGLHIRDTSDPHKVRDRLVDIGVLRKNEDGTYSPYLPAKADLVNGKVPASQLPEDKHGVTEVLVDGASVVSGGTARIDLSGKVDKEQGKGLSSNDYTAEEKAKLANIEAGAQKNVGEVYTTEEKTKLGNVEAGAQRNVTPVTPSTDASAAGKPADAKATGDALAAKQDNIADLATIRSGAQKGATAYQKPASGIPATDLAAAVQASLGKADTALQAAPVQSVNGQTGAVVLTGAEILTYIYTGGVPIDNVLMDLQAGKADAADLRYAIGATITASATLADRAANRVIPAADNTSDITLGFPQPVEGHLLDFEVLVTYTPGNTGRVIFEGGIRDTVYGDGFKNAPASGETWLYVITQVGYNSNGGDRFFWVKSEKMEVAQ